MIDPAHFHNMLKEKGINFFTGVPDSLLSNFCAYLHENVTHHLIAANEGNALALATGSYLATGRPGFVYLQNSGQGNLINPLISLADPSVYGIPMILLVGWRGEPGTKDEPQHLNQGAATTKLFDAINIPWYHLPVQEDELQQTFDNAYALSVKECKPVALVVSKGSFSSYKVNVQKQDNNLLSREEAIIAVTKEISPDSIIVATTGMISRELYSHRVSCKESGQGDFLTVGSMGHASQIAMGIKLEKPDRKVYCFDGDGAALMHLGAMAISGSSGVKDFVHIVFNNRAHDSVGGLPTAAGKISLKKIAQGCGYAAVHTVHSVEEINAVIGERHKGPVFIEIIVKKGSRADLARPSTTPRERKISFMKFLEN